MVCTLYRITNLQELRETLDAIQAEVNAEEGRNVDPSEIHVSGIEWNHIECLAEEKKLSDGSKVYDVEVYAE